MKMSKNFSLSEFTKSQSATRLGISNTPDAGHLKSLQLLIDNVLQPARDALGTLTINSGYRSPALNKAVGGSTTSQHSKGEAADIECPGMSNAELAKWIAQNCDFDQLILEGASDKDPSAGWVHVSYRFGMNRKQTLKATFTNGKATYTPYAP